MKKIVGALVVAMLFLVQLGVSAGTQGECYNETTYSRLAPHSTKLYDCVRCYDSNPNGNSGNCDRYNVFWCTDGGKSADQCRQQVMCSKLVAYGEYLKTYNIIDKLYLKGQPVLGNCRSWKNPTDLITDLCEKLQEEVKELLSETEVKKLLHGGVFDMNTCRASMTDTNSLMDRLYEAKDAALLKK